MKPTKYGLARIVAPSFEPVTLAEVKTYLRTTHTSEDAMLTDLITAAREQAENYLNMSLPQQSYRLSFQEEELRAKRLPRGPVLSIASVKLIARDASSTTLAATSYYLHVDKRAIVFDAGQSAHKIEIEYAAGYATVAEIPKPIKFGILAHINSMYEMRGDAEIVMPRETLALYTPFREVRV